MGKEILQDWVMNLGLRHQGVLLSAIRGCDTSARHSYDKQLARMYRGILLIPHCGDISKSRSFMVKFDPRDFEILSTHFIYDHDSLPHHYIMHVVHAWEIVGYYHPDRIVSSCAISFYLSMCNKFHLERETKEDLDKRLSADEETFAKNQ